jgi:hypothetical protein
MLPTLSLLGAVQAAFRQAAGCSWLHANAAAHNGGDPFGWAAQALILVMQPLFSIS